MLVAIDKVVNNEFGVCVCTAPLLRGIAGRLSARQQYLLNRRLETWRYGSGQDYEL